MTTTTPPTAVEMSKKIIDQISQAVTEGGDAASARAALADLLRNQGGAMADAGAEPAPPPVGALTVEDERIPRPNGEEYWVRKIGDHSDVAALRKARTENLFVLAYGEPGTGKTALIEAAYAGEGGVWTVSGSGDTETADFIGGYVQLPGNKYEWVDGPLLRAMEAGGVMFVDEVALIDPKVLSILYSVMDGRAQIRVTQNPERGVVEAKEGFYVAAACNPNAPGARMSEALVSRFQLQIKVGTDFNLAKRLGVPAKMVTAAQNMQRKLEKGELGWAPQLRELLSFKRVSETLGEAVALANMISGAPEIDRPQVQDILSRSYAKPVQELTVD